MQLLLDFFLSMKPQGQTVIILCIVISLGMYFGKIAIKGISLGIGGVLFAGLAVGHLIHGMEILNIEVLEFLREFGLILFVYTIGMQVGPGFFASLRKNGLSLNVMAALVVLLGVLTATIVHLVNPSRIPIQVAVGLLSGATTNTPGLGAAQRVLTDVFKIAQPEMIVAAKDSSAMAYAIAYPFGIVGIIITMILIRVYFKLNVVKSAANFARAHGKDKLQPININIHIEKDKAIGLTVSELAKLAGPDIVISRHLRKENVEIAKLDLVLERGDYIHAVGPKEQIDILIEKSGSITAIDLKKMDSDLVSRRVLVTEKAVLGRSLGELDLHARHGVTVTRITRAGIEFPHNFDLKLQYGDKVLVVGPQETVAQVSKMLGDSILKYNHPLLIPMFIGIFLGIVLGSIPIPLGMPVPLKLGLAGGPLIAAILLARLGKCGPLVFHIPTGANLWLREIGIVLFLACVGVMSGGKFVHTIIHGDGLYWMAMGTLITFIPLFIVGFGARLLKKTNYMQLCGMLAGSMTDPPALAFANSIVNSEGPAVSYATVYPLVMLLRIVSAQMFVIILSQLT